MTGELIDRQAALDALGEEPPVWYGGEDEIAERNQWRRDVAALKALPPAQSVNIAKLQPNCNQVASDCISRQAALDALNGIEISRYASWYEFYQKAITAVGTLPSAQPGWIPVTERLPKNGYWLWSANGGEVKKDFYWDGHWELAEQYGYEVLAWMPLPSPYREGGQK